MAPRSQGGPQPAQGTRWVDRLPGAAPVVDRTQGEPAAVDPHQHPATAEHRAEGPALARRQVAGGPGDRQDDVVGERLAPGGHPVGLLTGPAQQPAVLPPARAPVQQHEPATDALAVQHERDLAVVPLLGVVAAPVPDRHPAAAVLAARDLAGELQVLQRVVLGTHGHPDGLGVLGQPLGHRPRRQHPVPFEPQVPVQRRRVVLLHDEPVPGGTGRGGVRLGHRFGCAPRVAPAAVLVQGHSGSVVTGTRVDGGAVMTVRRRPVGLDVRGVPVEDTFDP